MKLLSNDRVRSVLESLYQGMSPLKIQDVLGLDGAEFDQAMGRILEQLSSQMATKPREHIYAEHMIAAEAIMRKLSETESTASARDSVSALKAQWEIRKDLLKTGRDLGIIDGPATDVGGGVNISLIQGMSSEQIRAELLGMLKRFKELDRKTGDLNILDVECEQIFQENSV